MLSTSRLGTSKPLDVIAIFILVVEFIFAYDENLSRSGNSTTESSRFDAGTRHERHLVFPTPGSFVPTKVQLITGLGLPMEVDVSMIVGYVVKFNYVLPYNASFLTHPNAPSYERTIEPRSISDGQEAEDRVKKKEAEWDKRVSTSRWEIYRVIESALDGFELSGKGCLLRTVCELAQAPFEDNRAGLVAELINVLLTPSTTREKYEVSGDQEYDSAEAAGRDNPGECHSLFPECDRDLLEYFTETNVMDEVMVSYTSLH